MASISVSTPPIHSVLVEALVREGMHAWTSSKSVVLNAEFKPCLWCYYLLRQLADPDGGPLVTARTRASRGSCSSGRPAGSAPGATGGSAQCCAKERREGTRCVRGRVTSRHARRVCRLHVHQDLEALGVLGNLLADQRDAIVLIVALVQAGGCAPLARDGTRATSAARTACAAPAARTACAAPAQGSSRSASSTFSFCFPRHPRTQSRRCD